ncbi:MAG: hypothetical protein CVT62_03665 [Actinobacteria bacterium HGW-Actinobacteria-2]|nr:MAG: hypothetical protein CVT62_03665 [Actinobacteria bacterium HGW-Actinobacteria-2]
MKRNVALQIIFAFFLGLVLVAFVWIGVITFYPEPSWTSEGGDAAARTWRLTVGIILLVTATALSAISLSLPVRAEAIANGVLLGGVFTMLTAVGMALSSETGALRFAVVTAALVVTIGIGYLRFGRGPRVAPVAATADGQADPELAARVEQLERRLDAIRRALD